MRDDLFRKQYDFELEQRNALASAINVPVVAITVLTSAASVALLDFPYASNIPTYAFLAFVTLTIMAVLFATYSVFRSSWNYEYQKLAPPSELRRNLNSLVAWHLKGGALLDSAQQSADADFQEFLEDRLAEAGAWNGQNNLVRGNFLQRATAAVAFAIAVLVPTAGL